MTIEEVFELVETAARSASLELAVDNAQRAFVELEVAIAAMANNICDVWLDYYRELTRSYLASKWYMGWWLAARLPNWVIDRVPADHVYAWLFAKDEG